MPAQAMSQFSEASMKIHGRNENLNNMESHRLHVLCTYFVSMAFCCFKGILANMRNTTIFFKKTP